MLSFIDYEKKSNPIIQGLCAISSPVIAQVRSLRNGRFLIPQGVSLMDKPGVLAAGLTDDFLRDHAVVLSEKHGGAKEPQLFLSLSGVYGTYDEAETQILNVVGRVAISNLDMFFKSPQNVANFFAANDSVLRMPEKDLLAHVQASIVLLREDTLRTNAGSDLPFTLVSEVLDSKSYSVVPFHSAELVPAPRTPTPQAAKTDLLIDFDADVPSAAPAPAVPGESVSSILQPTQTPLPAQPAASEQKSVVREPENYLGANYEANIEGVDKFFVTVFAQSKTFAEQIKPRLDEFVQSFIFKHPNCTSADAKIVQDQIAQVWKTFVPSSGIATNEEQNASIVCGLENYITSNLHKLLFPIEKEKDRDFDAKLRSLWFVSARHLDISEGYVDSFVPIIAELREIAKYRTPGNKFCVMSNVCKKLYNLCSRRDRKACSTDDFLPCLIFVVLKSGVGSLVSSLEYIQSCHNQMFLQKEALYYLTNVLSAVGFVQNISEKSLSIRKSVYDRLCSLEAPAGPPALRPDISAAYTFGKTSPNDLRIGDIPELLEQYKDLLEYFVKSQCNDEKK